MVSLSILAVTLVAISGINANSFESANYARAITVATLLARSKMIDIEMEIQKDGFTDSEKEYGRRLFRRGLRLDEVGRHRPPDRSQRRPALRPAAGR